MRIVFMGASELGWECCRTLLEIGQDVVGIFSIPREFRISWSPAPVQNVRFRNFEDLSAAHSLPLIYVTQKMSEPEYEHILRRLHPELLVVIGWYYMVPSSLREIAPLGAIGIHASLLPQYRGGAPLVWAMINGEKRAGVSLFHFADGVDDGDLIGQAEFEIRLEETIEHAVAKSVSASVGLVRDYIPLLAAGKAPRRPQDHNAATVMPQRKPEDGLLDWEAMTALQAFNWIRAQTRPYPGAFTYLQGEKVTLWRASLARKSAVGMKPGTLIKQISETPDTFGVVCADDLLVRIHEVGLASGTSLGGGAFFEKFIRHDGANFDRGLNR